MSNVCPIPCPKASCLPALRLAQRGGMLLAAALLIAGSGAGPARAQSGADSGRQNKTARTTTSATSKRGDKNMAPATVVVVFPVDTKGGVSDQVSDVITDVEQSRLSATDAYDPFYFLRSQPTIKRSLLNQTLNQEDVQPPFDNTAKVLRVMQVLRYPMAMVSSIDAYKYDPDKQELTFILSGRLIDVSGPKPRVLRQVTVTGDTPKNLPKDAREALVASLVARNAAEKLMTDLLAPHPAAAPQGAAPSGGAGAAK
jgi:hypothetical protein